MSLLGVVFGLLLVVSPLQRPESPPSFSEKQLTKSEQRDLLVAHFVGAEKKIKSARESIKQLRKVSVADERLQRSIASTAKMLLLTSGQLDKTLELLAARSDDHELVTEDVKRLALRTRSDLSVLIKQYFQEVRRLLPHEGGSENAPGSCDPEDILPSGKTGKITPI